MNCNQLLGEGGSNYQWPRNRALGGVDSNCTASASFPGDLGLGPLADNGCAVPTNGLLAASPVPASVRGQGCPAASSVKVTQYVSDSVTGLPLPYPLQTTFTVPSPGTTVPLSSTYVRRAYCRSVLSRS